MRVGGTPLAPDASSPQHPNGRTNRKPPSTLPENSHGSKGGRGPATFWEMRAAVRELYQSSHCVYGLPGMADNLWVNARKNAFEEDILTCWCFLHPWNPLKRLERITLFAFNTACIVTFTAILARHRVAPIWVLVVTLACTLLLDSVFRYFLMREERCHCSNELFLFSSTIVCIVFIIVGFCFGTSSSNYVVYLSALIASFPVKWLYANSYRFCIACCPSTCFAKNYWDQKRAFQEKYGEGVVSLEHFQKEIKDIPPVHLEFWEKTFSQDPYSAECGQWKSEEHRYWGTSLTFILKSIWNLLVPEERSAALPHTWRDDVPKDFKCPRSKEEHAQEESKRRDSNVSAAVMAAARG